MKDQNRRQRHHIRAARDWLGKAEHSLAEDNEVRGELKVMLAKAELAQANQNASPGRLLRWTRRLMPALAAVLIAGLGWMGVRSFSSSPVPSAAVTAVEESSAGQAPDTAVRQPDDVAAARKDETPASLPDQPAASPAPSREQQDTVPLQEKPAASETPRAASETAPVKPAPAVPDDHMQKLMQTAGKALRK